MDVFIDPEGGCDAVIGNAGQVHALRKAHVYDNFGPIKNWAETGAVQKNWQSGPSGGQFWRTALGNVPHRKCAFATFWCWGQNHPMSMPVTPIIANIAIGILVKQGGYRQNLGG